MTEPKNTKDSPISEEGGKPDMPEPAAAPAKPGNGKDTSEHPKFQERLDEMRAKQGKAERELAAERAAREKDSLALQELIKQNKEYDEIIDKLDQKVSLSSMPNREENPEEYDRWRDEQMLGRMEKMIKANQPATIPIAPTALPMQAQNTVIDPREAVQQGIHDDYLEIIKEVNTDIASDPALEKHLFSQPDPYKSAYEYGMRRRELRVQDRNNALNQAHAEGGSSPPNDNKGDKLTPAELAFMEKLNSGLESNMQLTPEKLIARRKKREALRTGTRQ
jgi:hypothetical protein